MSIFSGVCDIEAMDQTFTLEIDNRIFIINISTEAAGRDMQKAITGAGKLSHNSVLWDIGDCCLYSKSIHIFQIGAIVCIKLTMTP